MATWLRDRPGVLHAARLPKGCSTRKIAGVRAPATICSIGISYRESTLSQTLHGVPKSAPRAGDRFPWLRLKLAANAPVEDVYEKLDDTKFVLLVIGQPAPDTELQDLAGKLQILVVPSDPANDLELARTRIPSPSFYLLRPDGYIGLAGTQYDPATVTRYIEEHFR